MTASALSWERDGHDWPLRESSRFIDAAGLRWHVQVLGSGAPLLLLHGTGATTHSWRDLAPLLARQYTVIAPDLPGHGFTSAMRKGQASLPGIAHALAELMLAMDVQPVAGVGHSAGAAIVAHLSLERLLPLRALVSLNGALLPFSGVAAVLFAPMARLMAASALVPRLFAKRGADAASVHRLVRSTGSTLDARGEALYATAIRSPAHVAGALSMMANWDLQPLYQSLDRLNVPLLLLAGDRDRTVPHDGAARVAARVPQARPLILPGLGHLAHEEAPQQVATHILSFLAQALPPQCAQPSADPPAPERPDAQISAHPQDDQDAHFARAR